ncbi:MAG TPA: hypothetical protein PLU71_04890 [Candidatus Dependentiae bacterium]|nr:hypothetical protein [Candidatus Dependentiae bacterium]HRQ63171.1 hypothetical protein [Candidatus Dependentiae bacterium]
MNILNPFETLSTQHKGFVLAIAGLVLLLDRYGVPIPFFNSIVIVGSLYMIGYGIYMSGIYKRLLKNTKKIKQ